MENDYYKRYEPFFGSWYIKRFIGKGSYGKVFEVERKDAFGTVYTGALKAITVPTSEDELEDLLANGMDRDSASTYFRNYAEGLNREIALMSRLKGHSNIVSYEDHDIQPHEDGMGWDMLIRMELLTPITIFQKANKTFTRRQVIQLGIDLCRALEVCQKYNIIHRDIKPANIFLSETGDFKLGDFGVARIASATTGASTRAGTVNYMAPEVFRGEKYTSNVDIYSLGLVMYQLLNANRMPLCPPYPQLMTPEQWEQANARRLAGTAASGQCGRSAGGDRPESLLTKFRRAVRGSVPYAAGAGSNSLHGAGDEGHLPRGRCSTIAENQREKSTCSATRYRQRDGECLGEDERGGRRVGPCRAFARDRDANRESPHKARVGIGM